MIKPELLRRGIAITIMTISLSTIIVIAGWNIPFGPPAVISVLTSVAAFIFCFVSFMTE